MDKKAFLGALAVEDVWELVVDNPSTIRPDASLPELLWRKWWRTPAPDTFTWWTSSSILSEWCA